MRRVTVNPFPLGTGARDRLILGEIYPTNRLPKMALDRRYYLTISEKCRSVPVGTPFANTRAYVAAAEPPLSLRIALGTRSRSASRSKGGIPPPGPAGNRGACADRPRFPAPARVRI